MNVRRQRNDHSKKKHDLWLGRPWLGGLALALPARRPEFRFPEPTQSWHVCNPGTAEVEMSVGGWEGHLASQHGKMVSSGSLRDLVSKSKGEEQLRKTHNVDV